METTKELGDTRNDVMAYIYKQEMDLIYKF